MSAWMTSNNHISAIVTSAIQKGLILESEAQKVGEQLWRANTFSLKIRYGDKRSSFYRFKYSPVVVNDVTLCKLCHCFEYQSCEYNSYYQSKAAKLVKAVLATVSDINYDTEGYDEAPWGID